MENKYFIKLKSLKNENNIHKTKISGIVFARAFCSLGIVTSHFFAHSRGNFKLLQKTANSSFGFIFVTSFFCISGFVLHYNYPKIISIKRFYFKRWKSIFPAFYICFFYFYLRNVFNKRKFLYNGHWIKFFISIIGLDGYLLYKIKTYYLVGEWFLGAIVIIYILFPLLSWIIKKQNIFIFIFISLYYFFIYKVKYFTISNHRNIITCIISFYFGMNSIKYRNFYFENKRSAIVFLLILLTLSSIKISSFVLIDQIQGISFFIIIVNIGEYFFKINNNKIVNKISKLSYSIYLFHHQIIIDILNVSNPTEWYIKIIFLSITILLTLISAEIHLLVVDCIINSSLFKKFELLFI